MVGGRGWGGSLGRAGEGRRRVDELGLELLGRDGGGAEELGDLEVEDEGLPQPRPEAVEEGGVVAQGWVVGEEWSATGRHICLGWELIGVTEASRVDSSF